MKMGLRCAMVASIGLSCSASFGMLTSCFAWAAFTTLKIRSLYRRRSKRGFECFGSSVADMGSVALAMEWRPAAEQLMLVTSVALAYLAGIVTPNKPSAIKRSVDVPLPETGALLDKGVTSAQQFER